MHPTTVTACYMDDCEEYVPLSPSSTTPEVHTYSSLMRDAMETPPKQLNKEKVSPCKGSQQTHLQHSSSIPSPLEQSPTEPSASQSTPTAVVEDTSVNFKKGEKPSQGTKRQRASDVQWDDTSTHTLLRVYEEAWTHIKKDNLRAKDWEDVIFALNKKISRSFNSEQTCNCIDTLKKTHKKS
ncbi:hypothetical protein L7F22_024377 [Adiantum nelumboides]|nr:hypothetical protein [Adiantum nelumboides]